MRLEVSVRELAGDGELIGVGIGTPLGRARLQLGQQWHDRYREQARQVHPGYREEVSLRWETTHDGVPVLVRGRLDGLYHDGEGWVVEEIKTLLAPEVPAAEAPQLALGDLLGDLADPRRAAYEWQCRLYCHLLALTRADELRPADREGTAEPGGLELVGQLALIDARTGRFWVAPVDYDPEQCARFVEQRLATLIRHRIEEARRIDVRREAAARVVFPFPERRPFQDEMAADVAGAVEGNLALLVSAPTGIGKTAAALVPALRACLAANQRLMVVTAKISQQTVALDLLAKLGDVFSPGREILAVQLEARERSCPREEMHCSVHACPLLRQSAEYGRRETVAEILGAGGLLRDVDLRQLAALHGLCPFEVGLLAAELADLVVCDFNYAFHPAATLDRFFDPGARARAIVIDEAHNLHARARDFLSPVLDRRRIRELAEGALHGAHPVFGRILELLLDVDGMIRDLEAAVDEGPRAGAAVAEVELDRERIDGLAAEVELVMLDYLAYAKSGDRRPPSFVPRSQDGSRRVVDPFIAWSYDVLHFARAARERGDHMTALLRRDPAARREGPGADVPGADVPQTEVKIFCSDPSAYLAARHRRFRSVTAMSATLEPLGFFADVLGVAHLPRAAQAAFPSPFPPDHRLFVVDTSISTRYADRDANLPAACRRMVELAALRPGRYIAFLPSYAVLETVALLAAGLAAKRARQAPPPPDARAAGDRPASRVEVIALRQGDPVGPAIERLSAPLADGSLLLCAAYGGPLSEGVDLAGDLAHGAFLFGPALPAVDEEHKLIQAYYDRRAQRDAATPEELETRGFDYAFLYPGLARVVQAAGRVIRGPDERGIIVLLGRRFAEPRYRALLPGYWQDEMQVTDDPTPAVREFWRRHAARAPGA